MTLRRGTYAESFTRKCLAAGLGVLSALLTCVTCGTTSSPVGPGPQSEAGASSGGRVADADNPPGEVDGGGDAAPGDPSRIPLTSWTIQSSAVDTDSGAAISQVSYAATGWYPTTTPSTVLASLVANGAYQNILTGMNFRSIPGTTYPIGTDFLLAPVPTDSPYAPGWWFRTQFDTPATPAVTLHFEGISYRADIYLNGQQIAASSDVLGTYRRWDFDIKKYLATSGPNTLAVKVTAQESRMTSA